MHNKVMNISKSYGFITDIALESAEATGLGQSVEGIELSYGIQKRTLRVKTQEESKRIGRERGVYITFDCKSSVFTNRNALSFLTLQIARSLAELIGILKNLRPYLSSGLAIGISLPIRWDKEAWKELKFRDLFKPAKNRAYALSQPAYWV